MGNAPAFGSLINSTARILGMSVGAVLVAAVGPAMLFAVNAVSFAAVVPALLAVRERELHTPQVAPAVSESGTALDAIRTGFAYLRRQPVILTVLALAVVLGSFGRNYQVTMAAMSDGPLRAGASGYGFLSTVFAIGTVVGALVAARQRNLGYRSLVAAGLIASSLQITAGLAPSTWTFATAILPIAAAAVLIDTTVSTASSSTPIVRCAAAYSPRSASPAPSRRDWRPAARLAVGGGRTPPDSGPGRSRRGGRLRGGRPRPGRTARPARPAPPGGAPVDHLAVTGAAAKAYAPRWRDLAVTLDRGVRSAARATWRASRHQAANPCRLRRALWRCSRSPHLGAASRQGPISTGRLHAVFCGISRVRRCPVGHVAAGEVIGSSRFYGYDERRSEIEIGWTFLARSYWGGQANGQLKTLMLEHAFRFVERVVFLVGPNNRRSQRALEKIGAVSVGTRPDAAGQDSILCEIRRCRRDSSRCG